MIKKSLLFAVITVAAVTSFQSCSKTETPVVPDNSGKEDVKPDDNTPKDEAVITIDGKFEDWNSDKVVGTEEVGTQYTAIDCFKAYCDAENLYMYYHVENCDVFNNIRFMIDTDDDETTGTPAFGASTYVVSTGYSAMFNITSPLNYTSASPYSDLYGGDSAMTGSAKITMKKSINSDTREAEFEMAITRESLEKIIPFEADNLRICLFALDKNWAVNASIPSPESKSALVVPVNND